MNKIAILMMTAILGGCTAIAEESIHSPLCPPEEVSTGMCINNPQSPCCDPGED